MENAENARCNSLSGEIMVSIEEYRHLLCNEERLNVLKSLYMASTPSYAMEAVMKCLLASKEVITPKTEADE